MLPLSEIFTWPPTPRKWKALRDYLVSTRVLPGRGLRVSTSTSGMFLSAVRSHFKPGSRIPLYLLPYKPEYVPTPVAPLPSDASRVFLEWGDIAGVVAENWNGFWDLTANAQIWADINLVTTGDLRISTWSVETGPEMPETPNWNDVSETARPGKHYILLAQYFHTSKTLINTGGGSIQLAEHVANITSDLQGGIRFHRSISHWRMFFVSE